MDTLNLSSLEAIRANEGKDFTMGLYWPGPDETQTHFDLALEN